MSNLTNSSALIARPQRRRWLPGGLGPAVPALLLLFVFFVVPWMAVAIWLSLRPSGARLGAPAAPWRPLTDYPPPTRDQQDGAETQSLDSGAAHDGKHAPIQAV